MSWSASQVKPGDFVTVPAQEGGRVRVRVQQVNARKGRALTVHVTGEGVALRFRREAGFVVPVGQLRKG